MWNKGTILISALLVLWLGIRWFNTNNNPTDNFQGKIVVVTGASSGIGEQVAYRFSENGAKLILVARREEALKKVAEKCKALGASSAIYIPSDLGNSKGANHFFQEVFKHFNTIDVLVLNHVTYNVQRWHSNISIDHVTTAFNTNVISYINLATLFLPSLQASKGRLVVISSGLGVLTYPYFALYCSNKYALHGFFGALRQDLALEKFDDQGMSITISVLGPIKTESALKASRGNLVAGETGWTRLSSVDASVAILDGALRRERQMYFPYGMALHEIVHFYFPSVYEKLIRYVYGLE